MNKSTNTAQIYDVPLVTVEVAIFTVLYGHLYTLLEKRSESVDDPHSGKWNIPGGFIDLKKDVDLDSTAKRILEEKTRVAAPYLEQLGTVGNAKRDWRGWSVSIVYFALIPNDKVDLRPMRGTDNLSWFRASEIKGKSLAFDHGILLKAAEDRLCEKVKYTTLPILLMPREFTLPDLQAVYESILGKKQEAKSFRRRITASGVIEALPVKERRSPYGPKTRLYRAICTDLHYFIRNIIGVKD
jgi:8-oxo-dGTP diphosphatase